MYGRCVGAGTALIGAAFCAVGILRWVAYSQQVELVILTVGVVAGGALILYGQLRYNRRT